MLTGNLETVIKKITFKETERNTYTQSHIILFIHVSFRNKYLSLDTVCKVNDFQFMKGKKNEIY